MAINFKKIVARLGSIPAQSFVRASNWRMGAVGILVLAFGLIGVSTYVAAQSDIRSTKHNLSKYKTINPLVTNTNTVRATDETQVCVFCHTPHGANTSAKTPLWNRSVATSYTMYSSSSLDAKSIADGFSLQPGGSSLLCLSCHDGMIALGNVNVLPRNTGTTVGPIAGLSGTMATLGAGSGSNTGFTRHLGTDLSNDHPISITFNDTLALADKELAYPGTESTLIGIRSSGVRPTLPLEKTHATNTSAGQVQCATCHDPHITKDRFLRLNRFQVVPPTGGAFIATDDQICLACHRKLGTTWSQSAHANNTSGNVAYKDNASVLRGFPNGKKVWEVGCLNCHDTHTASGSRRLLREGVGTAPMSAASGPQPGSTTRPLENVSSIENTCYQCHTTVGNSILGATGTTNLAAMTASTGVPDIFTEFARLVRMPIKTSDQNGGTTVETHDIRNADFFECRKNLGNTTAAENTINSPLTLAQRATCDAQTGSNDNRHVECTDCHNPHRVIKNSLFNGLGLPVGQRTHVAGGTAANLGADGNIASGVLRGAWGVEPSYTAVGQTTVTVTGTGTGVTGTIWPENPTFTVKFGDPGADTSTDRTKPHLTREYQLCFKCHSNYAQGETAASFPSLGNTGGGTPLNTNGMTRYTNVAAEFAARATDPPSTGLDQGEITNVSTTCVGNTDCVPVGSYPRGVGSPTVNEVNHRSWHPVVFPTGRSGAERGSATFANIKAPFATTANIGKQTMQCSDCHGQGTSWTDGTGPKLDQVQGPHGSTNNFLLKGTWSSSTGLGAANTAGSVCENCHVINGTTESGLEGNHVPDSNMAGATCMRCHIAVPHGWKNKAFLVNKRCVGKEGGEATDCVDKVGFLTNLNAYPYYVGARNAFLQWRRSRDAQYNVEDSTCNNVSGGSGNMKDCAL